ncbi:MAG: cytochrome c-type biogenesis protein CcmH [Methylovulum sp.]|jgi:cytochrome c-type biogenesis protein CcmH|nr:cytochrome c-type biogenesis protein CcmH [Methylovulum sp.]
MKGLIFLVLLWSHAAYAIDAKQFTDQKQQAAYESLTSELRCLVCQNQTIADSNAELAADLRRQVYEMLQQGQTSEEIIAFMTARYGDFVLYKPPFKIKTSVLWLGPLVFLSIGLLMVFWLIRTMAQKKIDAVQEQGQQEKLAKIRRLLNEEEERF